MNHQLQRLQEIAPFGYSVGLHIRFAKPLYATSTMPRDWQDAYAKEGYALRDPTIFWGIGKAGSTRWSEITLPDPFGVMEKAAECGLNFGATVSCGKITSRTLIGIAAGEREFTDAEIADVTKIAEQLHNIAGPPADLTSPMIEVLGLLGSGATRSDAAAMIGISEATFSVRVTAACQKLGVPTVEEALAIVRQFRLIKGPPIGRDPERPLES